MEKDINAFAAKRAGCKVREPTQNARAHAKCVDPRKVQGPSQSERAALWVRGLQLRGEVSGPHCPRTSPALAIQCPRNATAVPLTWAAMSRNRLAR